MRWRSLAVLLLLAGLPHKAWSRAWYVGLSGDDGNSGSESAPFATIKHALGAMTGGDEVIVLDGLYVDRPGMLVNDHDLPRIPSGTDGAMTTIRAQTPFGVRLLFSQGLDYYDAPVYLGRAERVHVDGFVIELRDLSQPSYAVWIDSNRNLVTRTIVKRSQVDDYGGWFMVGGNDNVIEDCAGVGAARYGFSAGGPIATTQRVIFRRCVGRMDFAKTSQPKATFSFYGNDSGTMARDALFQNCVALDGQRPGAEGGEEKYGGFYFPKNVANVRIQGSIVLHEAAAHAGMFVRELSAGDVTVEHSVVWDAIGSPDIAGIRANGNATGALHLSHVTVGKSAFAYYNKDSAPARTLADSLFEANGGLASGLDFGWTLVSGNAFQPAGQAIGDGAITTPPGLLYLPQAAGPGASVLSRYGGTGTRWGDPGFDQPSSEALWPWPFEAQIAAVFGEQIDSPPGFSPSGNVSRRGFVIRGGLTRYVWEYLGHPCPASACGTPGSDAPDAGVAMDAAGDAARAPGDATCARDAPLLRPDGAKVERDAASGRPDGPGSRADGAGPGPRADGAAPARLRPSSCASAFAPATAPGGAGMLIVMVVGLARRGHRQRERARDQRGQTAEQEGPDAGGGAE